MSEDRSESDRAKDKLEEISVEVDALISEEGASPLKDSGGLPAPPPPPPPPSSPPSAPPPVPYPAPRPKAQVGSQPPVMPSSGAAGGFAPPLPSSTPAPAGNLPPSSASTPGSGSVPPAPMPPAAQGGQGYAPPVPGAPAVPVAAGPPNAFMLAVQNLWFIPNDIWRGKVTPAFNRPARVTKDTGDTAWNWVVPFLANSLLVGLFLMALLRLGNISFTSAASFGYAAYAPMGAGPYLQAFFIGLVFTFGFLVLRGAVVLLAHRVSGSQASFLSSVTGVAVAQSIWWLPLVVASFLNFIAASVPVIVITFIGLAGVSLMTEILTYISVSRQGPHKRSPLVPYVWFTVAAYVLTWLLLWVLGSASNSF